VDRDGVNGIRPPVAAGSFYPARPGELAALVDRLLAAAAPPRPGGGLRALVVPHAGYAYSGAVAATAFAAIPAGSLGLRVALRSARPTRPLRLRPPSATR
jgi:AmmeMemoRadiSam system protein B